MLRLLRLFSILLLLVLLELPLIGGAEANESQPLRCPVCGMFVAPYPNWIATITLASGERLAFDGPKDMFRFMMELPSFRPDLKPEDLKQFQVTEYYSTRKVDAASVFFIAGSDVLGPMGQELVPVAGKEQAETFLKDHGGTAIMQFDGQKLNKVDGGD